MSPSEPCRGRGNLPDPAQASRMMALLEHRPYGVNKMAWYMTYSNLAGLPLGLSQEVLKRLTAFGPRLKGAFGLTARWRLLLARVMGKKFVTGALFC